MATQYWRNSVGCNFAPRGWAMCQGQLISISQNTALFSLLGTTYGGNGTTTFGLPDLQGRVPVGMGSGAGLTVVQGEESGSPTTTLSVSNLPAHNHALNAKTGVGNEPAPTATRSFYQRKVRTPVQTALATSAIGNTGSGSPFNNMQPFLGLNFCIALEGIFPSRN